MSQSFPIGIFDSGFGGLTTFKQIRRLQSVKTYNQTTEPLTLSASAGWKKTIS